MRGKSRLRASIAIIAASDIAAPWMPWILVTRTSLPERRQIDKVIHAGPQRLNPLQIHGIPHHVIGHHRTVGHENIRAADVGINLAVVIDQINEQIRKRLRADESSIASEHLGALPGA